MKRFLSSLVIFILLLFVFVNNVKADLSCSGPNRITATETTMADPASFSAYMPLCQMTYSHNEPITSGPGVEGVSNSSLKDVARTGEAWTTAYQRSVDGKAVFPVSVQVCNDPKATLSATMQCSYIETWPPVYDYCIEYEDYTYTYLDQSCFKSCQADNENNSGYVLLPQNGLIENPNVEGMRAILRNCDVECTKEAVGSRCKTKVDAWCGGTASGGALADWFGDGVKICGRTSKTTVTKNNLSLDTKGFTVGEARTECQKKVQRDCACFPGTTTYTFDCPVYVCNKVNTLVDLCTPSFKDQKGNSLYCVNPGQPFSPTVSQTEAYQKDKDFNVRDCESSYSTVDCGYANILIEGQKYNISDKAVELALRLWGVHTQQAGFDRTGVSNRINSSCSKSAFFMRGDSNEVVNPYVKTYNEFRRELLSKVRSRGTIDPVADVSLLNISCDSDKLGVACGGSAEYKQALALLANTILGNSEMQDHLSDLFKGEINESINNVNLITDETGDQYVEIHFEEIRKIIQDKNVKINCKNLAKMVQENKITSKQKDQIEPYCKVEVAFVDGNGKELGRLGGGTPDYCYKDYCRIKVAKFAMCDIENEEVTPISIKTTTSKPYSEDSVNKYVSCANPYENQLLFGFDKDLQESLPKNSANLVENPEKVSETYVISNYRCAGKCDDYSLRGEVKENCSDDLSNMGKTFNSSIKDPSLKCIVNMGRPEYKNMYDYSEYFGVNTNLCRIYCSDEVNFKIADKTEAISGRYFYYDVESNADPNKNIRHMFTNIVEEKRSCVSEIYYSNDFAESINWKKIYGLGTGGDGITDSEINGIRNWTNLFHVLVKKALREGGREENVNKILYDLMNCNLYSEEEILASGVKKPQNYQYGSVREKILDRFSERNKYGLAADDSCVVNRNKNECVKMNNINYDFGAPTNGKTVVMNSVASVSDTFNNMTYCSGSGCFAYDPDHPEKEFDYPTNTRRNESEINITSTNGTFMNLYGNNTIKIPTNDYVMFEIKTNVSFYNVSKFETKPSGEVIRSGSNNSRDQYMKLPSYAFPVDKDAYNLSTCVSKNFLDSNVHRCTINHSFDKVKTFFRRNPDDEFSNKVRLTNKFSCYVDVKKPGTIEENDETTFRDGTIFRNVDVSNLFPSSSDGYTTRSNSNWATSNGRQATSQITSSAENLKTSDEYLDYSITLSPTQIRNIKEYNKENEGYINEPELSCKIVNDTYQRCTSPFMNELRNSTEYGTIDLEHSGNN